MIDLEAQLHIQEYENFVANIIPQNMIVMTNLFHLSRLCHFESNQVHFSQIGFINYVSEDVLFAKRVRCKSHR
jgi:hypothetical protein